MPDESSVPGISRNTLEALRLVVRQEVQYGVEKALNDPERPPCQRINKVEKAIYGNSKPGLLEDVTLLKEQVGSLVWQNRATIAAVITALIGVAAQFVIPT